jgi:hypothetical protein
MSIPISKVKEIRESLGMSYLVLFARDEKGLFHVASHGDSWSDAEEAAGFANNLKKHLGWPPELCNTKPLERICKNCSKYKTNYIPKRPDDKGYCVGHVGTKPKLDLDGCPMFESNC